MGELIAFISGKGGQGKTGIMSMVAKGLAAAGKKVLAIDLCYGCRQLDLFMGLENMVIYNIDDVLCGKCELMDAAVKSRSADELYLLSAPHTKDFSGLDVNALGNLLFKCKSIFDYVLIDCPSGFNIASMAACVASDRICGVFIPDAAGVRGMDKIIGSLDKTGRDQLFLVVDQIHPYYIKEGSQMGPESIEEMFPYPLYACIPFDPAFGVLLLTGKAGMNDSKIMLLIKDLCDRIMGRDVVKRKWESFAGKKLK